MSTSWWEKQGITKVSRPHPTPNHEYKMLSQSIKTFLNI